MVVVWGNLPWYYLEGILLGHFLRSVKNFIVFLYFSEAGNMIWQPLWWVGGFDDVQILVE